MTALVLMGASTKANEYKQLNHHHDRVTKRNQNVQPIIFMEGGIKFLVSPEGDIDYKIRNKRNRSQQGRCTYQNYGTPGTVDHPRSNRNRFIQYDYYGRLKKVGTTYISYDRFNRVRRVGSVIVRYNRKGLAHQVGGMYVHYNRYGAIKFTEGDIHYASYVHHKTNRRIDDNPANYRKRY